MRTHRIACISRRHRRTSLTVHGIGKRIDSSQLDRQSTFQSATTSSLERQRSSHIDTGKYQIRLKTIKREFLDKETKLQIELIDDKDQREIILLDQTTNKIVDSKAGDINTKKALGNVCSIDFTLTQRFSSFFSS